MNLLTIFLHLLAMLALLLLAVAFQRRLRRLRAWHGRAALLGAVTFVIAARVLEPVALLASGLAPWLAQPGGAVALKLAVAAGAAALFEELGRLLALRVGARRAGDPLRWCWSFGVGYAGAELLLIGVVGPAQLLWLSQSADAAAMLASLPAEAREAVQRGLAQLGPLSALWLLSERLATVVFQLAFTLLVATAVSRRAPALFGAALGLHFMLDLPAAAHQLAGAPLWAVELSYVAAGFAAAQRLRRRWPPQASMDAGEVAGARILPSADGRERWTARRTSTCRPPRPTMQRRTCFAATVSRPCASRWRCVAKPTRSAPSTTPPARS